MNRQSVVVVGGGISGLAAAWELSGGVDGPRTNGPRIEVLEAAPNCGGVLATATFAGRTIDLGADGFLARRPEATTLVHELGLDDELVPMAATGASIWLEGALRPLPSGFVLGVPTSSAMLGALRGLSRRARLAAWRDEHFPRALSVSDDVSIGTITRRKLGDEITHQLIEPMIGGIQAGRVDDLSAASVFPALFAAAQRGGSLMKNLASGGPALPGPSSTVVASGPAFYSLRHGVGSLVRALETQLRFRGVIIRCDAPVTALRATPAGDYPWEVDTRDTTTPANAVIVTTPSSTTSRLLAPCSDDLAALRDVTHASVAIVTFALPADSLDAATFGTGFLVPLDTPGRDDTSLMTTAVTFLDRKWPHLQHSDDVVLRAHVGRSDDERSALLSDAELIQRVGEELSMLLARAVVPLATRVQRWSQALPQYRVGHGTLVARARTAAADKHIALAGNTYDGVGIPASIGSGRRAARDVLDWLA